MHAHLAIDLLAWAVAAGLGMVVWRWRLKHVDAHADTRWRADYVLALVSGAVVGAFLFGSLNLWLSAQPGMGRSAIGALVGAIVAVELFKTATGVRGGTGLYFAAPLAAGLAVGRFGCYTAGLDDFTYGVPTTLPIGVDFGDGVIRHPVQLYEAAAMGAFLTVYVIALSFRWKPAMELGFYGMIIWYGLQRFAWEFIKPYGDIWGPFNLFHFLCAALIIYGVSMIVVRTRLLTPIEA